MAVIATGRIWYKNLLLTGERGTQIKAKTKNKKPRFKRRTLGKPLPLPVLRTRGEGCDYFDWEIWRKSPLELKVTLLVGRGRCGGGAVSWEKGVYGVSFSALGAGTGASGVVIIRLVPVLENCKRCSCGWNAISGLGRKSQTAVMETSRNEPLPPDSLVSSLQRPLWAEPKRDVGSNVTCKLGQASERGVWKGRFETEKQYLNYWHRGFIDILLKVL